MSRCCNAVLYNRQLHPDEEKKLKELQKGKTPEEQYRLAAAECALVPRINNNTLIPFIDQAAPYGTTQGILFYGVGTKAVAVINDVLNAGDKK